MVSYNFMVSVSIFLESTKLSADNDLILVFHICTLIDWFHLYEAAYIIVYVFIYMDAYEITVITVI